MINFMDIFGAGDGNQNLSTNAAAFMNAVSENESRGKWNVIYGGSTFDDYSHHPRKFIKIESGPNKGKFSSAAGKFQITYSTYKKWAPKLGIKDFTPESQMKIAWAIAKAEYKRLTGNNLQAILDSGDEEAIKAAAKTLNKQWTSLPGGIEASQTKDSFYREYLNQQERGSSAIPKVGLNGELVYQEGDFDSQGTMGYRMANEFSPKSLLPTELAKMTPEQEAAQTSIVKQVEKLLKDGIVVPSGTRDIKAIASQAIDMPAADLIAAGVYASGLKTPPGQESELSMPSPLTGGIGYTPAGRVVSPGVIDVGAGGSSKSTTPAPKVEEGMKGRGQPTSVIQAPGYPTVQDYSVKPKNLVSPQSTAATLLPALAATLAVKAVTQPATPAPKATGSSTKSDSPAAMTPGDQRLQSLVDAMTKTSKSIFSTGQGLAGSAELPKDYKPSADVYPTETPKKSSSSSSTSSTPAPTPKPVTVSKSTGALDNQPVSLSNPVLKPVASSTQKSTTVTQSVKPVSQDLLKQVESILAQPTTTPVRADNQIDTSTTRGANVQTTSQKESVDGRKNAQPTQDVITTPATKVTVTAPIQQTKVAAKPLGATVSVTKALDSSGKSVVQSDLKDLKDKPATGLAAKVGGAVTETKKPLSPLDILGDLLFGGGELTTGLLSSALSGKKVRTSTPSFLPIVGQQIGVTAVSGKPIISTAGDIVNKSNGNIGGTTATGSQGSYGSSPGQSTKGLKPGDREYNADTNTWELKN